MNLPYSPLSHKLVLRSVDYDVFGHCWVQGAVEEEIPRSSAYSRLMNCPPESEMLVRKHYESSMIRFEAAGAFPEAGTVELSLANTNLDQSEKERLFNLASHLYSLHSALEVLSLSGRMHTYDYLVLSRFDTVITKFPNWKNLNQGVLYVSDLHPRFPDMIFVGSPENVAAVDAWPSFKVSLGEIHRVRRVAEDLKREAYENIFGSGAETAIKMRSLPIRSNRPLTALQSLIRTSFSHHFFRQ